MQKRISLRHCCLLLLTLGLLSGCAGSHFSTMNDVQQAVQAGNYQHAEELMEKKKELKKAKNEVLYALEQGLIAHLNAQYDESNRLLTQAAERMEELDIISVSGTASGWLFSEKIQPYRGEDFERVIVHYYMSLNYLMLGDLQEALVECRRVNTLLREFNDRYEHKNVYKTDAFILYLSGIIYDAMGETNDAFVDYRNAYNAYTKDYNEFYETPVPLQLQEQLLRTTSALGFNDILETYRDTFQAESWPTQQQYQNAARLVIIWDSGFIPYKTERVFRNYVELDDDEDAGCYIKFAFPDLVSRVPNFSQATVSVDGITQPLELVEELGKIAIKNLEDRRIRTLAKAVTRNIVKCAAEYEIEKENQILGYIFGALTELTEGADTRHWLLLPADIYVTQLLVEPGVQDVTLSFSGAIGQADNTKTYENIQLKRGKTTFLIYRTF